MSFPLVTQKLAFTDRLIKQFKQRYQDVDRMEMAGEVQSILWELGRAMRVPIRVLPLSAAHSPPPTKAA